MSITGTKITSPQEIELSISSGTSSPVKSASNPSICALVNEYVSDVEIFKYAWNAPIAFSNAVFIFSKLALDTLFCITS